MTFALFYGSVNMICDFQFLSRVADVLTDYLGDLNEDIIKDNFVLVYQVYFHMLFYVTSHNNFAAGCLLYYFHLVLVF